MSDQFDDKRGAGDASAFGSGGADSTDGADDVADLTAPAVADVGAWLDEWEDLRGGKPDPARETRRLPVFNLGTPPDRLGRLVGRHRNRQDSPGREPAVAPKGAVRPSTRRPEPPPAKVPSPPPVQSSERRSPTHLPTEIGSPPAEPQPVDVHEVSEQIMVPAPGRDGRRPPARFGTEPGAADSPKLSLGGIQVSVDTEARGLVVAGMLVCCAILGLVGFLLGRNGNTDVATNAAAPESSTTTSAPDLAIAGPVPTQSPTQLARATVQLIGLDENDEPVCAGSGFFVEQEGTILTNAHVVVPTEECRFATIGVAVTDDISNPPELLFAADVVAVDEVVDLAVLRVTGRLDESNGQVLPSSFPVVALGDSDFVALGDDIRIFGYPVIGGDTITSTAGTVSGFTSQVGVGRRALIKTDAAISAGNSGGLAVNTAGQVIGIPTRARASESGPAVDCRALDDTNDDGSVDGNDFCVPVGGFLNGIRPIGLARDLLAEAEAKAKAASTPRSTVDVDWGAIEIGHPRFSTGVTEENWPVDRIVTATEGIRELCLFVDWSGIPDGAAWDSVWSKDGETIVDFGIYNQLWSYGPEGLNFWLCAEDEDGLTAGVYEVGFFIDRQLVFAEAFEVTSMPADVYDVAWVNNSGADVCSLSLNPLAMSRQVGVNELLPSTVLGNGQAQTMRLAAGRYTVEALGCDGVPMADESDSDGLLIPGEDYDNDGSVVFIIGAP
jgi:S1-C subfamily serine protease